MFQVTGKMSDDEFDLDAMLDEAADDVLQKDEEANDLLDDVLDDVLGAAAPAPAPMQIASPARRAPVVSTGTNPSCMWRSSTSTLLGHSLQSDRQRLEEALSAVLPQATAAKWIETIRQDEARLVG